MLLEICLILLLIWNWNQNFHASYLVGHIRYLFCKVAYIHVKWVPSPQHGMSLGCRLKKQLSMVAANKLSKQPQTADKGWPSSLGVGHGANNLLP